VPGAASAAFARNVSSLLLHMVADGVLAIDPSDDIQAGVVITHGGEVIHPATAALLPDDQAHSAGGITQ
jgi:NAD(P) transhydrogenase subunit alpha